MLESAEKNIALHQHDREHRQRESANLVNAKAQDRKWLENELRNALARDQLSLLYQPKIDIASGDMVGAEALLRWEHPERGNIPPDEFIPIAESSGLISPIGEWVLRAACQQCAAWIQDRLPQIPVAVNISTIQFRRSEFVDIIKNVIEAYKIEPNSIELEITESMIMGKRRGNDGHIAPTSYDRRETGH